MVREREVKKEREIYIEERVKKPSLISFSNSRRVDLSVSQGLFLGISKLARSIFFLVIDLKIICFRNIIMYMVIFCYNFVRIFVI